jgi:hypothetical protein
MRNFRDRLSSVWFRRIRVSRLQDKAPTNCFPRESGDPELQSALLALDPALAGETNLGAVSETALRSRYRDYSGERTSICRPVACP